MKSIHSIHISHSFLIRSLFLCLILGTLTGFGQDSTGPTLVSVTPERNAKEVDPNSAVTFNFSVPMKRQHAIMWISQSGPIDTNRVGYAWSADQRSLSVSMAGGWPAKREIQWILMPSVEAVPPFFPGIVGFEDVEGNGLEGESEGAFQTGAGGNPAPVTMTTTNSCGQVITKTLKSTFSIILMANQRQTGPETLIPNPPSDGQAPFQFMAIVNLLGTSIATNGSVHLPSEIDLPLNTYPMSPVLFATEAVTNLPGLINRFPPGTYRFNLQGTVGIPASVEVPITALEIPTLRISNFTAAQTVDASQDFGLAWTPLSAGSTKDPLRVEILDSSGQLVVSSPDAGCPGALNGDSTSFIIPAGSLKKGIKYRAQVMLSLYCSATEINEAARSTSLYSVVTELPLTTAGGTTTPPPPVILGIPRKQDARLLIDCTNSIPGGTYVLESGSALTGPWSSEIDRLATGPTLIFDIPLPTPPQRFFRVMSR